MNVNNKKCGIMAINCSTDTTFKIQNQLIPSVKKYKYLGIEFNDEWNNKAFFKAKKIKTFKSYMGCYSILKRNDIPSKFKVMVTKAIIQAVETYVHAATQTLAKCGKSAAMIRLKQELSLTDLNIKTAVARTSAFKKCSSLRTWISDLIKCPYKNRCDTWVSGCTRWIKKYNGNINKIKNTIETLNNRQKKNDKSQISKWIADTEAEYTGLHGAIQSLDLLEKVLVDSNYSENEIWNEEVQEPDSIDDIDGLNTTDLKKVLANIRRLMNGDRAVGSSNSRNLYDKYILANEMVNTYIISSSRMHGSTGFPITELYTLGQIKNRYNNLESEYNSLPDADILADLEF
ncbi:hypothetical protein BB561_001596 [Smittium simulii]|uniref:Uncharacterized protein n=1 Tax=Smittium simulii TaxID=133385 RepID=A0A2T9YTX8_9FUNG|nr:hypothetical protein BB561_001596 [Smittium simulii]